MLQLNMTKGIAIIMAVLSTALASMGHAQTLNLPNHGSDPIVLHSSTDTLDTEMLKIYVSGASSPIAGRYVVNDTTLSFVPAFGFEPGQEYVARFTKTGAPTEVFFPSRNAGLSWRQLR